MGVATGVGVGVGVVADVELSPPQLAVIAIMAPSNTISIWERIERTPPLLDMLFPLNDP